MTRKNFLRASVLFGLIVAVLVGTFALFPAVETKAYTRPTWSASTVPDGTDVWDGSTVSESLSGSGTEEDPYLLQSAADFAYFYVNTNSADTAHYKLTVDVAFGVGKYARPPVAVSSGTSQNYIAGTLDGDGHTVYNLGTSQGDYGTGRNNNIPYIFRGITATGTIKNITFDGVYVRATMTGVGFFGSFALGARIKDVSLLNIYCNGRGDSAGGVICNTIGGGKYNAVDENGEMKSHIIEGLKVQGFNTAGNSYGGGLFGRIDPSFNRLVFRDCDVDLIIEATGTVTSIGTYLGNIAGNYSSEGNKARMNEIYFENCVSRGLIYNAKSEQYSAAGGFVGSANIFSDGNANYLKSMSFKNCVNETDIYLEGSDFQGVGGFVGRGGLDLSFTDCVNAGDIYAVVTSESSTLYRQGAGGFVGGSTRTGSAFLTFTNCAQNGDVTTSGKAGGYVGVAFGIATGDQILMYSCSLDAVITGDKYAAGILAYSYDSDSKCGICYHGIAAWDCSDAGHRAEKLDYFKTSYSVGFLLESCSIRATVLRKADDGNYVPGSLFLDQHVANRAGFISVDANSYLVTNCTDYVGGKAQSNSYGYETYKNEFFTYARPMAFASATASGTGILMQFATIDAAGNITYYKGLTAGMEYVGVFQDTVTGKCYFLTTELSGEHIAITDDPTKAAILVLEQTDAESGITPNQWDKLLDVRYYLTIKSQADGAPTKYVNFNSYTNLVIEDTPSTVYCAKLFSNDKKSSLRAVVEKDDEVAIVTLSGGAKGVYTAEDYPDSIPANPADIDHAQYGALAKLNEYAYANGSHFWKKGEDGKLTITYDLAITTPDALTRTYNGKAMSVIVTPHSSVSNYTIHWQTWSESEGRYAYIDTPPVNIGKYRLEIKTYDLMGDFAESVYREFTIDPININLSEVVWDYTTPFVFDKQAHTVAFGVDELAAQYLTITYENATATGAGTYTATATVVSSSDNVVVTGTLAPFDWQIAKREMDVTDLSVVDTTVNYSGTPVLLPIHGDVFDWEALDIQYSMIPVDAGTYTITATLSLKDTDNYSGILGETSYTAELTILPIDLVLVAEDSTLLYTGAPQTFPITVLDQEGNVVAIEPIVEITHNGVAITPDQVVNAGEYIFTLSFANSGNYSGAAITVRLTIERTTPTFAITGGEDCIYDGIAHPISAVSSTGKDFTITYYWNGEEVSAPINAGNYTIVVHSTEDHNHYEATQTLTMTISPKEALDIVASEVQHVVYTGSPLTPSAGLATGTASYTYTFWKGGEQVANAINTGTYTVLIRALSPDGNFFGLKEVTLVIERAETIITVTDKTVTYDGYSKSIDATKNHGESGLYITYIKNGVELPAPRDAGVYTVLIHFNGSLNYKMADATATLTILPQEVSVPNFSWNYKDNLTYDGTTHTVTLKGVDADKFYVEYQNNAFVNAGTYSATATVWCTPNYVFADGFDSQTYTLDWTVKRATFSLAGISLRDTTVPYDGTAHSIAVSGNLIPGVQVTYSGSYTDVGTYQITATFTVVDASNFDVAGTATMTATLTIIPVDYDMSGVTLLDQSVAHDGKEHTLVLGGTLPAGVTYEVVGSGTNPGAYTIVFKFTGDSNHNPIPDMKATLYIMETSAADEKQNVKIDLPAGIPYDGRLSVLRPYLISENYDTSHVLKGSSIKALYEMAIRVVGGDANVLGPVRIYLPVGEEYDGKNMPAIVRVVYDADGNVVEIIAMENVVIEDGYYVFETDTLAGTYGIVTKDSNVGLIIGVTIGALAVIGGVAFGVVKVVSMRRRDLADDE